MSRFGIIEKSYDVTVEGITTRGHTVRVKATSKFAARRKAKRTVSFEKNVFFTRILNVIKIEDDNIRNTYVIEVAEMIPNGPFSNIRLSERISKQIKNMRNDD